MAIEVGSSCTITDPAVVLDALLAAGWRVIGPRLSDSAIAYEPITDAADLPRGFTDEQEGGHYRLIDGGTGRWFDYVVGPQSWKKWLFPPRQKIWSGSRTSDGFEVDDQVEEWPKTVFFGVRACEIAAMQIQDRVFDNGQFVEPTYKHRRDNTLIIAVQCARSASTCFCASMDTGPRADAGFDIALTELTGDDDGKLLVEVGSAQGAKVLESLDLASASDAERAAAQAATAQAAESQVRTMPQDIAATLRDNPEHPRWNEVAERCLSCANCTLACPTCFCSDVEEVGDLTGDHAERWRVWDSCFTIDFSYVHGGAVRRSTHSRYRQWMTHKLSSWHDQFGSSGCVGCGRCVTWCPVGIDITEEAAAFAAQLSDRERR